MLLEVVTAKPLLGALVAITLNSFCLVSGA
jgi:hypothetical protein